jgi:hypothetical protein
VTSRREFDLNIERVLENWTVAHAIREAIANALDEAALTGTGDPEIAKDAAGRWHVRDFGRGLRYEHLTQNENREKLANPEKVVGKFGVGLKDALATFDRRGVGVRIRSRFGDITTEKQAKHGFTDITTLHAVIDEPSDPGMTGTDVELTGATDEDVEAAKALFRHYAGDEVLEETPYGVVLARPRWAARIYVNGLRVAEERNYLFSYDITSPTKALRAALNRERSNVGRTAYTDRVKAIVLAATSERVASALAEDLSKFETGRWHDEVQLVDVGVHACQVLNASGKVIFLTPQELNAARDFVDRARNDGYRVVVVPQNIRRKLAGAVDITGAPIVDLDRFKAQWNESFQFSFVDPADLSPGERAIFDRTDEILALRGGGRPSRLREILISTTMRLGASGYAEAAGVWEPREGRIVIKREQLASLEAYAGTLLHEVAHAVSGTPDVSAGFEDALTSEVGTVATTAVGRDGPPKPAPGSAAKPR